MNIGDQRPWPERMLAVIDAQVIPNDDARRSRLVQGRGTEQKKATSIFLAPVVLDQRVTAVDVNVECLAILLRIDTHNFVVAHDHAVT